jgi:hypothetical protein
MAKGVQPTLEIRQQAAPLALVGDLDRNRVIDADRGAAEVFLSIYFELRRAPSARPEAISDHPGFVPATTQSCRWAELIPAP